LRRDLDLLAPIPVIVLERRECAAFRQGAGFLISKMSSPVIVGLKCEPGFHSLVENGLNERAIRCLERNGMR